MGFSSVEATNARVMRRTRREIFLRFFFALRLAAAFFFADLVLFWLAAEACGSSGAAEPRDMEPLKKKSETASTGTHVFTIESSLARETFAQKRTIVVSQVLDNLLVEIAGGSCHAAAVTFFVSSAALLDIFLETVVEVPIFLAFLHLGLVVELNFIHQQLGKAAGLAEESFVIRARRRLHGNGHASGSGGGCSRHGHRRRFGLSFG